MEEDLKCCPLCGNKEIKVLTSLDFYADMVQGIDEDMYYDNESIIEEEIGGGYIIQCLRGVGCGLSSGWMETKAVAVSKWNNRAGIRPQTAVVYKNKAAIAKSDDA